jgi:hypothetical protein
MILTEPPSTPKWEVADHGIDCGRFRARTLIVTWIGVRNARSERSRSSSVQEEPEYIERMFERTMGDFNRDCAYARAHPGRQFEGDPIEFYRRLTAELDSAIEAR